ncbi:hypothetical protein [Ruminococcus flavefaciens]|uniref:Uncharacterized protein n=1 Tax=Ruminococcus flavefaciens TaxID=1265 RepID=A0A1K1P8R1_RUMFL|nr:hypothetical protein [Ruminococcus flavefaciens]SFW43967.1 hypothetical protein SAMN02910280_2587 [Ruminococcus flavefaciens]
MEKKYTTPEMEITEFEAEDVITTSGGANGNNEYEYGGSVID